MENQEYTNEVKGGKKAGLEFKVQMFFIVVLALLLVYNAGKLSAASSSGNVVANDAETRAATGAGIASASEIIPLGIPAVYGAELGVKYDDVSPNNPELADRTISALAEFEGTELSGNALERYIKIGSSISCEYCCGAKAIIFSNGERACGCAHSYAMRGLAKYLLTKHSDMSDESILSELGKWKVLFFPSVHEQKAQVLKAQGINHTDYINLASNKYRGVEQGQTSGGSMVGGC